MNILDNFKFTLCTDASKSGVRNFLLSFDRRIRICFRTRMLPELRRHRRPLPLQQRLL
jgi:hypothetical protein